MSPSCRRGLRAALVLPLACSLAACSPAADSGARPAAPGAGKREVPLPAVRVAEVRAGTVTQTVERVGTLRALREVRVHVQEEGRLLRLPLRVGMTFAAGDELLALDDTLLAAEAARAQAELRQAEAEAARLQRLADENLVAEEELQKAATAAAIARAAADTAQARLGYARVVAPWAGVVRERRAEPGDVVARHAHVLTLHDPGSVVAEIAIPDGALAGLRAGQRVTIHLDAAGQRGFPARVSRLPVAFDPATRLGVLELTFDRLPPEALPGGVARAALPASAEVALRVPLLAVRADARGAYVLRLGADDTVQRVGVRLGAAGADNVAVLEGLAAGERVVVQGFVGLQDGAKVRVAAPESP